jgi:hypothetical protein
MSGTLPLPGASFIRNAGIRELSSPTMRPLLLATHAAAANPGAAAGLLAGTGAVLIGLTAYLAARLL